MNLQAIQKRIEELSAELLTLSNDLSFILQGSVSRTEDVVIDRNSYWAEGLKAGDYVKCVAVHSLNDTRKRCFTVGKTYRVDGRLSGLTPANSHYGIRVEHDDEGEGHDAEGVVFVKAEVR